MKLWILIFSAALFAGGTCLGVALHPRIAPAPPAATPASPAPWQGRSSREISVTRFAHELELSGEQDRELDAILGEVQEETQALSRALRAAHERGRERVTAILSAEQSRKLDGLLADERQKRSEQELQKSLAAYQRILQLTPEQSDALRKLLAEGRRKRRDGFKSGGDHEAMKASWRQQREEQNLAVQKLLKPDQYARYLDLTELER